MDPEPVKSPSGELTILRGRVVTRQVRKRAGMREGLVWIEAYLPLDVAAYAEFMDLTMSAHAGDPVAAAAASPDLASKALTPVDAHGEAMLPEQVVKLAHEHVLRGARIDLMHDEVARDDVRLVESFVNGPEVASPNFWPGAWVVVLKVDPASPVFAAVDAGVLDAVSFQAWVIKQPVVINLAAVE